MIMWLELMNANGLEQREQINTLKEKLPYKKTKEADFVPTNITMINQQIE